MHDDTGKFTSLREALAAANHLVEAHFENALAAQSGRARAEVIGSLNQAARRLQASGSVEEWSRTLQEFSGAYSSRAEVFAVTPEGLVYGSHPPVVVSAAPAFQSAIESKDTVVAVATPGELSPAIFAALGSATGNAVPKKIYLFPIWTRQKALAVLYAEGGETGVDVSALELLTALAAASRESIPDEAPKSLPVANLITIAGAAPPAPRPPQDTPSWEDLPRSEQEHHLRAQRFARTRVAEMVLHKNSELRLGRTTNNLYGVLKEEIENGREAFRKEFIETCPSMVDYFHLELQRTLAKNNAGALGAGYPGPLPVGSGAGSR